MYMPLYLSILLTTSAIYVPVQLRVDGYGKTVQDNTGNRLTIRASDETAGIGVEFETPFFQLKNEACSTADTDTAKRQVIAGRRGTNFELTADTLGFAGILNVEYILDGKNIKVGSGDAARAGAAAAADIVSTRICLLLTCIILTFLDCLAALEYGRHRQYRCCE